jgi:hypothetical protein
MAITSIKTGSSFTNLIKYNDFLAGNPGYDPAATFLIQRVAGTGSSGTITFSSIPQNYKHLQLRCMTRSTVSAAVDYFSVTRFNSDSGNNYSYHYLFGNGSSAGSGGSFSQSTLAWPTILGNTATANCMTTSILDIHDYASTTKNKTVRTFEGWDANGTGAVYVNSALWQSTAAINSITIVAPSSANFLSTSTFALYGMVG